MARINQLIETLCFEVIKLYKYYTMRVFIRRTVLAKSGTGNGRTPSPIFGSYLFCDVGSGLGWTQSP